MSLSDEQLAHFQRDGYLVIEGFAPGPECDALRARADALVDAFDPRETRSVFTTDDQARRTDTYFLGSGDAVRFFYEPLALDANGEPVVAKALAINKIGHALHDLEPLFDRFSRAPRVERLVASLGLASPRLLQSMYIFKQPRIGGEVRCHQDATFLHTHPPEAMVGLWFALEDATEENGCLWAVPGGHRAGLQSLFIRNDDDTTTTRALGSETWSEGPLVPLPVKKGAVIVLDGLLPHLSKQNESDRSRHAYTLHLISGRADYPATNWLRRSMPARGF